MKIARFSYDSKRTPQENMVASAMAQTLANNKIYELLHKQIWRKAPYRIASYANPYYPMHNGRPVRFVSMWNIKDGSTKPYSYDGGDPSFGLDQLFMGQDFRKSYVGNPKSGIYHDDCFIQPKMIPVVHGKISAWCYVKDLNGFIFEDGYEYVPSAYYAENVDRNGQNIVLNAVYESYMEGTTSKHRVIQTNADNSTTVVELGTKTDSNGGIHFAEVKVITGIPKTYAYHFDFTGHGQVIHEEESTAPWTFLVSSDKGWTKCYEDGTVVQYNPKTYDTGDNGSSEAHYIILPMMYTDTGDLTMDRVEFVERWNDYFELIVHEDSEWWQGFIKPIMAIITVVIACYTGIIYNPIGAIGAMLSVAGTLGENQNLSLLGGVMMAGAGIYNAIEEGYSASLMKSGVFPDRAEVLIQNASFGEMFQGFVSNAGLSNLSQIGGKAFSIGNDISQLGRSTITQSATTQTSEDAHMKISFSYSDDEEDNDVLGCIKKVIAL